MSIELTAAAAPQDQSADTLPTRSAEASGRRPARLGFLFALVARLAEFVAEHCEYSTGDHFYRCRDCAEFHSDFRECARLQIADCAECVDVVYLDSYGWCRDGGRYHAIANRRPADLMPSHKREVMRLVR